MSTEKRPPIENGVLTLSGYGIDLRVNRGYLEVEDGVADERRSFRLSRVSPDLERVVVFGHAGTVTLQALRWIRDRDAAFVQIDHDGEVLVSSEPEGRSSPELLRAQVLAAEGKAALEVGRELIRKKIEGQIEVLKELPGGARQVPKLEGQLGQALEAETGKALAHHESLAARAYWDAWAPQEIALEDPKAVPEHWTRVGGRRSPLQEQGNLYAVTPAHAMLNYLYAVVEAEARLTALQFGFDPGIGIFHATYQGRDSFPLDLMEPVRPVVDRYVWQLLQERTFTREHFFENREGVCRILPALAEELSQTAILWREPLRELGKLLADALMAAGDTGQRGAMALTEGHSAHGESLGAPLRTFSWTPDDLAATEWKQQLRDRHKQNRSWERTHRSEGEAVNFEEEILPGLQGVSPGEIAKATGLSETYGAEIRRGDKPPHRRHWAALAELAERGQPEADRMQELEDRFEEVDFQDEIRAVLDRFTLRELSKKTGLSTGYLGEIRRGESVPSLEHWPALAKLTSIGEDR